VVRALLSAQLPVVGNADGSIGGILIDHAQYQKFIENLRRQAAGIAQTPAEAARELHCDHGAIASLMQLGHLTGRRTPVGIRVGQDSVERFKHEYTSLAHEAAAWQTSVRALMRRCEQFSVPMLLVPITRPAGPQPFIRIADGQRLFSVEVDVSPHAKVRQTS
jgi:hypothetical protein